MAKTATATATAAKKTKPGTTDEPAVKAVPDEFDMRGFEDVTTPDIDGWYDPNTYKGAVIGTMVGAFAIRGDNGTRTVAVLKLQKSAGAMVDGEEGELEKGQHIGVGIRSKLGEIMYRVNNIIYLKPTEKVKLKGGKTMWKFDLRAKGRRSDKPFAVAARPQSDAFADDGPVDEGDMAEVPF